MMQGVRSGRSLVPRKRDDELPRTMRPVRFVRRRRSLDPGEEVSTKADLVSQIRALCGDAKRLRAQRAPPEPELPVEEQSDDDPD